MCVTFALRKVYLSAKILLDACYFSVAYNNKHTALL